jgi:cytidylate kinase
MGSGFYNSITAALVDRQMRNWELARSQRLSTPAVERPEVEDFICVSRMVGVGDAVSNLLASRLGWPIFDKQILATMAGDDSRRRQVYASMDERDISWWEDVLNPLIRSGERRNDYYPRLCETVLSLARQSPSVFIGRGLDRVLPSRLGFRVQLVAPLEVRVGRYADAHGLDAAAARREIERIETDRSKFIRHHFGVDATDPLRHDLTVNVDRLPVASAVEIILHARLEMHSARSA